MTYQQYLELGNDHDEAAKASLADRAEHEYELSLRYDDRPEEDFGCPDCGRCDCVCDGDPAESDGVGMLHVWGTGAFTTRGSNGFLRYLDDPMAEVIVRRLAHLGATVTDDRGDVFVDC